MSKLQHKIRHWKPVDRIIAKSKRTSLPGFHKVPIYDVAKFFAIEMQKDGLAERAASVSFNFLMAIPPTFMFIFTLLPLIPLNNIEPTLYSVLRDMSPNQNSYNIIHGVIYDFLHTQRYGLLSFTFVLTFFFSSNGMLGIMRTFNQVYKGNKKRSFFHRRWVAIKLTSLLILLFIVSMTLIIAQNALFNVLFTFLHIQKTALTLFIINAARWVIIIFLFFTIFSLVYTYGPALDQRWRFITAGSTLATILTILTSFGFSFYVNNLSRYNKIYGSLGTLIILMIWIFLNALILLIGYELNACINIAKEDAEERAKNTISEEEMQGFA